MNPDRLFDYLDGRLPAFERGQLEEQLLRDPELQRELAMARRIHSRMHGESREVLLEGENANSARGRKMAMRVGTAFIILMGVNVAAGLWLIARHESANPNRKLLENQMREQIRQSAEHAAGSALPTPSLEVDEVRISVDTGRQDAVAGEVIDTAVKYGGSGTKGLPDENGLLVFTEVPAQHAEAFVERLSRFGTVPAESHRETSSNGKTVIRVRIIERTKP